MLKYENLTALITNTKLTTTNGNARIDCDVINPGDNQIASVLLDSKGSMFIEVPFNRNSSATQRNAIIMVSINLPSLNAAQQTVPFLPDSRLHLQ
jgi:hypothetical protein